jgi:hypothetical protein
MLTMTMSRAAFGGFFAAGAIKHSGTVMKTQIDYDV